jgi:hypothetical protein
VLRKSLDGATASAMPGIEFAHDADTAPTLDNEKIAPCPSSCGCSACRRMSSALGT